MSDKIAPSQYVIHCTCVHCHGGGRTIIGAFYRSQQTDEAYIETLRSSLQKIPAHDSIWLLGDFNLPDFDWTINRFQPSGRYPTQSKAMVAVALDYGLQQLVDRPTRGENMLDLIFTNRCPSRDMVFGPLLFLIYIYDIENNIDSQLRLFADNCLLYRVIKSARDCVNLQKDISQLCDWESMWQMTFNSSKCFVMHMSHKKNPWLTTYIMQDVPLQSSITQKYLGVELTSNLDWNIHINTITTKANQTLGLLRRHLRCCSPATKETAYKALVRPQLEYCSAVWDPKGDTEILEKVQRRAARFVKGDYRQQSSVTQMIKDLGWQSLQERRAISRLSLMYKIVHGLSEVQLPNLMR